MRKVNSGRKIQNHVYLIFFILFCLVFSSCKNFLSGSDFRDNLEKQINYAKLPYANVTISALSDYTKQITPAAGLYDNKYKNQDHINLNFLEKNEYQFISWSVEPQDAVTFEDIYSTETAATIQKSDKPIVIKPVCALRPTVSFEPENRSDGVAKNTSIVITFSHPMDISDKDLERIKIASGMDNITYCFLRPELSKDKKQIIFLADRTNLISLASGTKVVTITIPQDFYYLYQDKNIELQDTITYSYRINSQTNDKAVISIKASELEGQISYSGSKTYYLDDEIKVKFIPDSSYLLHGWKIADIDGNDLTGKNILQTEFSDDLQTITVKLLNGYDKEIQIQPICTVKGKLSINFTKTDGSGTISPTEKKEYYQMDEFNLSYTEGNSGYAFLYWTACDSITQESTDAVYIEDETSPSTKVTVLKDTQNITIKPVCALRPTVSIEPENRSDGVAKNTPLIITSSQPLDISEEDLGKIKITSGLEDLSVNFEYPKLSDDKTKITFTADRTNLIQLSSGTKLVTVTVPQNFYYLYKEKPVTLKEDFKHSYRVNSQTLDKVTINVSTVTGGDISYTGKDTYNLDDELTVTYTPLPTYDFIGWSITNSDGSEITNEDGILQISDTSKQTLTVKVLSGMEDDEIQISPICNEKGILTVNFETKYGAITPIEQKKYYKDNTFEVSYSEGNSGYTLKEWKAYDAETQEEVTDIVKFKNPTSLITTVEILQDNTTITIKPVCIERPKVKLVLPGNNKSGLVRNTSIKILFSQPMDKEYLTKDYIKVSQGVLRSTNQQLFIDDEPADNILRYTVNETGNCDLLSIELISENGKQNFYQMNAYVTVKISKDVKNSKDKGNISLADDYEFQFQVSNGIDALAPIIKDMYVGKQESYSNLETIDYNKEFITERTIENKIETIQGAYNDLNSVSKSFKLYDNIITSEKLNFYVHAEDIIGYGETHSGVESESEVASIGYRITSVLSTIPSAKDFVYENTFGYTGTGGDLQGKILEGVSITNGTTFSIDLNDLGGSGKEAPDGILRIDVYAIDKNGNNGFDEQYWNKHGNGYRTLFVAKDNNSPKIVTSKWQKTYFDKEFTANSNGVKEDSYIKFKIEEGLAGIESFDIELKDSNNATVALENNITIKYSETDNINSAKVLTPKNENTFQFNNNKNTYDEENLLSGWYYITGLINSSLTEGSKYTLTINVKDGFNKETKIKSSILVDHSNPYLKGGETDSSAAPGPVVENYTFTDGNNTENVFPRVGNPGLTGHDFKDSPNIPNGDGNEVRWFYTNSWNSNNEWGVYLKQEFTKSNISQNTPAIILYQKNSDETLTDTELAQITKETVINNPTKTFTLTSTDTFTNYFGIGTHSFVVMNDAGVVTPAYTFVIVKDDKGPVITTSNNRAITYLITYDFPDYNSTSGLGNIQKNTSASGSSPQFDWYSMSRPTYLKSLRARTYNFKCNTIADCLNNKFIIRLSGSYDSDSNKNKNIYEKDGNPTYHNSGEYWQEAWPSRTSSGISQYYVCRVYSSWRRSTSGHMDDPFIPALPPDTNTNARFLDDIIHDIDNCIVDYNNATGNKKSSSSSIKYNTKYSTLNNYFDDWKAYTTGTDIEITPFVKDCFQPGILNEDYKYRYYMAPITLFFKDNCGNIDYMILTKPNWAEYAAFAFSFDVKEIN